MPSSGSPEMAPPGFEIPGPPPPPPPPPSESPPSHFDSFNSASPGAAAPPGFEKPNAWMVTSATDTWDPPPSQTKPAAIGNGNGDGVYEYPGTTSIREEIGTPTNCQTVRGPLEAPSSPVKIEILDPAMLVPPPPPPPPSPPPEISISEKTLIGGGLGEAHWKSEVFHQPDALGEEQNLRPVQKPETAPQGDEAPFEGYTVPLPTVPVCQLAVPESVSESLNLQPSPPPLPMVSESVVPGCGYESLDLALTVDNIPESIVLESKYDNLNQNTCDKGPTRDEIPLDHQTVASEELVILDPAMLPPPPPPPPPPPSPPPQFKPESEIPSVTEMTEMYSDNNKMLESLEQEAPDPPNQQMETFSFSQRDGTPDMLSSGTYPHVNQITNEPLQKKSQNMHEMQGQLTPEACPSELEKDRLASETPELSPHQEEDMEALQIDMDMSEDETLDRSLTYGCPPGSHKKESDLLEEAPPGYNTIDSNSQMEMISQDVLSGVGQMVCGNCHELISYPRGALHVLCTCCQTINLVLEACQVGNINCGQCSVLLMYPFGAPSVRCSCCRYVTEIGAHNMRPPLSIQQGESYFTLDLQLTEIS